MRNDIQIFNSEEFGFVRTAGTTEIPLFCLIDVCKALELDESQVARRLEDGVCSTLPLPDNLGRLRDTNFVNEDGLYDVIFDSRKPEARKFRKWVTSEVLPSIRKTGAYVQSARSTFMELDGTLPLFLSHMDIAQAISGLDCLMALSKRQRKLLDELDKTYNLVNKLDEKIERLTEELKEKKARIKELEAQVNGRKKKVRTKKGGAS
jgi:prophage antirepressor-like protein